MKIRLMGTEDLVRGWAAELEREYSMRAAFYPMRGKTGMRAYLDMDDRQAATILMKRPIEDGNATGLLPSDESSQK